MSVVAPYLPTQFASPVINPQVGSLGSPALPYISVSQFQFAPTALNTTTLVPGGSAAQQVQSLADTIARASSWADEICFGYDPATQGASLAASLSVESDYTTVKNGELRLICDYKPILEVTGVDVGADPSSVASIGAVASMARIGRRTIYIPWSSTIAFRQGDQLASVPTSWPTGGKTYAVWSYVNGYPHTQLVADVLANSTTCTVAATNGSGGLWGVFPASGTFPGTALTIYDGALTERVFVQGITPGTTTTTLTTTPFANTHTVPAPPDFLPVTALPTVIHQAVISLTMALIKIRGSRALVMQQTPGSPPNAQALAQAGALEDYRIACDILRRYAVKLKR